MPSVLITGANKFFFFFFFFFIAADGWQVYASYRDLSSDSKLRRLANTNDEQPPDNGAGCHRPLERKGLDAQTIDLIEFIDFTRLTN